MSTESERLKAFLETKEQEYEQKIKKEKKKKKIIKFIYIFASIASITSSTVVSTTIVGIPALAVSALGCVGVLSTSLSVRLNLKGNNRKLEEKIRMLYKIKNKINTVIASNGDLTTEKCKEIMAEFST